MGNISNEINKFIAVLEENENMYIRRVALIMKEEYGKVRFLDENVFPLIEKKKNQQALEVTKAFRKRLGDVNEKQKNKTENS